MDLGLGIQPQEHFAVYTLVMFGNNIYAALKLMQNCYLHYNINIINHESTALWCHMLCWKTILTIWQNMMAKILIFKVFNELRKIWKCNLGFSKIQIFLSLMNQEKLGSINSPRPTFQNPNFKSMDELGKVMS